MPKKAKSVELSDFFNINGRQISLKPDVEASLAAKLFIAEIERNIAAEPQNIPVKELLLQTATLTLGKIERSIDEFKALIASINQQLPATDTEQNE